MPLTVVVFILIQGCVCLREVLSAQVLDDGTRRERGRRKKGREKKVEREEETGEGQHSERH